MVAQPVRAIYEHGQLRLLDPVDLAEGQEIQLVIVSERDRAQAALGNMLVQDTPDVALDEAVDEAALLAEIDAAMKGKPGVSDVILEERREGP